MSKIGLVLEGGGMRGVYTAGILDCFLEHGISFDYVIGVSAGANNASNFISGQLGRSKRIFLDWSRDKRFLSFRNILKYHSYFGMEFLFNSLPNQLDPFDYNSFYNSNVTFCTCASNCTSGLPTYFYKTNTCPLKYMNKILRASSSLPILSPSISIDKHRYLDGFITDPIPIDKSMEDGNFKNVVILTKSQEQLHSLSLSDRILKAITSLLYPKLRLSINFSKENYNNSLAKTLKLARSGHVFLFKPGLDLLKNRYGNNNQDLEKLYDQGYQDATSRITSLRKWINQN